MMAAAQNWWLNIGRCRLRSLILGSAFMVSVLAAGTALAKPEPQPEPEAQPDEAERQFKSIQWTSGPAKVGIAGHAEIQVPQDFAYTGSSGAQKLLELMHNPTSGTELGIAWLLADPTAGTG